MSSDLLIGYTGMVSFGHSAFFGLGMYGAAAALLTRHPPICGSRSCSGSPARPARRLCRLFLDPAARHLFRHHHADLLQIFYVIIFTWTAVTGGENGLIFDPPASDDPGPVVDARFTPTMLHWFVLAVVAGSYLILRRVTQSPFGMVLQSIRENEARTRAIGYPVERYKMVSVMLSGLFAGLAGVLYAHPERIRRARFRLFSHLGRHRHLQRHRRHRHAGRPDRRRRLLPACARIAVAMFGDQFPI